MTSTEGNDLVPAQEKLEWVTPKISLMDAGDTDGRKSHVNNNESTIDWGIFGGYKYYGSS